MNQQRLKKIRSLMEEHQADQLIVSDPSTIFYLTGRWLSPGERLSVLLVDRSGGIELLNNELFPLPADFDVPVAWYKDTDDSVALLSSRLKGGTVAVDKIWPARFLLPLMAQNPGRRFLLASPISDGARLIKDESEQQRMRAASAMNDSAMHLLMEEVREGVTELELSAKLKDIYRSLGSQGVSFDPIVAFGPHGADPHHVPGDAALKSGETVLFDIGCRSASYCSDMTRTFFFREVTEEAQRVYEIVRQANLSAISAARPGATFSDVDRAARDLITANGYGAQFTHRTGHGIGIDVHEPEDVSSVNGHVLRPGMVFSIEPGIYLPGQFGVRIEDLVLITDTGCVVLNEVTKDLTVLDPA